MANEMEKNGRERERENETREKGRNKDNGDSFVHTSISSPSTFSFIYALFFSLFLCFLFLQFLSHTNWFPGKEGKQFPSQLANVWWYRKQTAKSHLRKRDEKKPFLKRGYAQNKSSSKRDRSKFKWWKMWGKRSRCQLRYTCETRGERGKVGIKCHRGRVNLHFESAGNRNFRTVRFSGFGGDKFRGRFSRTRFFFSLEKLFD